MLLPIEDATLSPLRRLAHLSQIPVTVLIAQDPALVRKLAGIMAYYKVITALQRPLRL